MKHDVMRCNLKNDWPSGRRGPLSASGTDKQNLDYEEKGKFHPEAEVVGKFVRERDVKGRPGFNKLIVRVIGPMGGRTV